MKGVCEIERKFRLPASFNLIDVRSDPLCDPETIRQGYIRRELGAVLLIRDEGGFPWLIAAEGPESLAGEKHSMQIDTTLVADLLWKMVLGDPIEKKRYSYDNGDDFGIDFFQGALSGLVLMTVNFLNQEEADQYQLPRWAKGAIEVTGNPRYLSESLSLHGIPQ